MHHHQPDTFRMSDAVKGSSYLVAWVWNEKKVLRRNRQKDMEIKMDTERKIDSIKGRGKNQGPHDG